MKRLLALALLVPLLLPSCRSFRGTMPQKVAYVSFTAEGATHWLGGKRFAATGSRAQAAPVTYHMVMKDETWYLEESSVRPAAGQFYYNEQQRISAEEARAVLSSAANIVTRMRGSGAPSAAPGSSGRKLYTLAVNSKDTGKGKVLYYEGSRAKDKRFLHLLQTLRNVSRKHGSVLPLGGSFAELDRAE